MTKSELIARDKRYIDVISGAVYRENGECVNVTIDGIPDSGPLWNFDCVKYELFTPGFSWELFKEGLVAVRCEDASMCINFKYAVISHGIKTWCNGENISPDDITSNQPVYYADISGLRTSFGVDKRVVVIPFSEIPPELLQPASVPQKLETLTNDEWRALTDEQRTACNELIQYAIKYDKNGFATNLQCYNDDSDNYSEAYNYCEIGTHQYRIEPAPVYEPFDKFEPWMMECKVQEKEYPNMILTITRVRSNVIFTDRYYTYEEAFNHYNLYDVATGETTPFGKVKGE